MGDGMGSGDKAAEEKPSGGSFGFSAAAETTSREKSGEIGRKVREQEVVNFEWWWINDEPMRNNGHHFGWFRKLCCTLNFVCSQGGKAGTFGS